MRPTSIVLAALLSASLLSAGPARGADCSQPPSPQASPAAIQVEFLPAGRSRPNDALQQCLLDSDTAPYLAALEAHLASRWSLPIGWHPFPSARLRFSISDHGTPEAITIVESTSPEYGACAAAAFVASANLPPPPPCLRRAEVVAAFLIPFNTIGRPVTIPEAPERPGSATHFDATDLPFGVRAVPLEGPEQ